LCRYDLGCDEGPDAVAEVGAFLLAEAEAHVVGGLYNLNPAADP
jgi:hypothetical protein